MKYFRKLSLEILKARKVLAALLAFNLPDDNALGPIFSHIDDDGHSFVTTVLDQGNHPRVSENLITNSGLQTNGVDHFFAMPDGFENAEIYELTAPQSAIGKVHDVDGAFADTEVLWLTPEVPLVIETNGDSLTKSIKTNEGTYLLTTGGNVIFVNQSGESWTIGLDQTQKIRGIGQLNDQITLVGAVESESGLRAAYFTFDASNELTTHHVLSPDDTFISEIIGIGKVGQDDVFVGNLTLTDGQQVVGTWSNDGTFTNTVYSELGLVRTINVSGSVVEIDDFGTEKLVPLDSSTAEFLGTSVMLPIAKTDLVQGNYELIIQRGLNKSGELFAASFVGISELGIEQFLIVGTENGGFNGFHNYVNPLDVNADGHISPIDALIIINDLNSKRSRYLTISDVGVVTHYIDASGDGFVSPLDALLVINFLNRRSAGGEGEYVDRHDAFLYDEFTWLDKKRSRNVFYIGL